MDSVDAAIPPNTCIVALPIDWRYFQAKLVQQDVQLRWGTGQGLDNGFFTVEKSPDGAKFETLTTLDAKKDFNTTAGDYFANDFLPRSINYYRITQTGNNGRKSYSAIIRVNAGSDETSGTLVYRQGVSINVRYAGEDGGDARLSLYDMEGRKVRSQSIVVSRTQQTYQISCPSGSGMYIVYIEGLGARRYAGKIMVN